MWMTRDADEGIGPDNLITTGVRTDRIPQVFKNLLKQAVSDFTSIDGVVALYLYGSVATGMARVPTSDMDLLVVMRDDTSESEVRHRATQLSQAHQDLVREVGVAAVRVSDIWADTADGLGHRCFIKHYCLHLHGEEIHQSLEPCRASAEAAWAFNHDIAEAVSSAKIKLAEAVQPKQVAQLSRSSARRVTLAAASLVSIANRTWTTDRETAARAIAEIYPEWAADAQTALRWCVSPSDNPEEVRQFLDSYASWVADELKRLSGTSS